MSIQSVAYWFVNRADELMGACKEENDNRFSSFSSTHGIVAKSPWVLTVCAACTNLCSWIDIYCIMHIKPRISQEKDVTAGDIDNLNLAVSGNVLGGSRALSAPAVQTSVLLLQQTR